jgi:KipI family sensor histidine kinase inhibitor
VGWAGALVELSGAAEVEAVRDHLVRRAEAGALRAIEIVPGARTVLVDGVSDLFLVEELATEALASGTVSAPAAGAIVEIPTVYDGPDLGTVAGHWNVPVEEVIERHLRTEFRVAFCGFAPGFGYLVGLPEEWAVPRLAVPRPRVPAGSVGLAGPYSGVYPSGSPGGWLLIGRTGVRLFDVTKEPPALLRPGMRVRFARA